VIVTRSDRDPGPGQPDAEERAAAAFVRDLSGKSAAEGGQALADLRRDPETSDAASRVESVWEVIGQNPNFPEILIMREQALARARRAHQRRWTPPWTVAQKSWGRAAGIAGIAVAVGIIWQLSPYGYRPGVYQTGIGEQRTIELSDHSHIALDASTRIRATLTADARTIEISRGQAQFNVAHDPARPFKVIVGGHTIVDVGTVFTVEYVDHTVQVALMEGKVAVITPANQIAGEASSDTKTQTLGSPGGAGAAPDTIELSAGEELCFAQDGKATVTPKGDIETATAWRAGKVIFHSKSLGEAVRRLNRYSHIQLQIDDPALSAMIVNGVFEAGDSRAFVEAVQTFLPVVADYSDSNVIKLRMK
jgi:transmembrane sensor